MPAAIHFTAFGIPRTRGSTKAFCPNARRKASPRWPCHPIVRDDAPGSLGQWMAAIVEAAEPVTPDRPLVGAIAVDMVFHVPVPATREKDSWPERSGGDLDKLARAVLDALHAPKWGGRMFYNDSQVVGMGRLDKVWARTTQPCVEVVVTPLEPQPLELEDYRKRAKIYTRACKPAPPLDGAETEFIF